MRAVVVSSPELSPPAAAAAAAAAQPPGRPPAPLPELVPPPEDKGEEGDGQGGLVVKVAVRICPLKEALVLMVLW